MFTGIWHFAKGSGLHSVLGPSPLDKYSQQAVFINRQMAKLFSYRYLAIWRYINTARWPKTGTENNFLQKPQYFQRLAVAKRTVLVHIYAYNGQIANRIPLSLRLILYNHSDNAIHYQSGVKFQLNDWFIELNSLQEVTARWYSKMIWSIGST